MANTMRGATSLTLDPCLLSPSSAADIEFRDTSYPKRFPPAILGEVPPLPPPLPPPTDVLAQRPNARFGIVRYERLGVLVKFGLPRKVKIEEAQALQALRRAFRNDEVPVPELYGWKSINGYNFVYMSIVPGQTLRDTWQDLS
jgi:hypothetical protein